jgi:hypothetical protein
MGVVRILMDDQQVVHGRVHPRATWWRRRWRRRRWRRCGRWWRRQTQLCDSGGGGGAMEQCP